MIRTALALILAPAILLAQTEAPTPSAGPYVVSGRVYKMPRHVAAADVVVSLTGSVSATVVESWNAVTDPSGEFVIRDLPNGSYLLTASLAGFHTACEQPYQVKIADRSLTSFEVELWPDSRQETCLFIESPGPAPTASP